MRALPIVPLVLALVVPAAAQESRRPAPDRTRPADGTAAADPGTVDPAATPEGAERAAEALAQDRRAREEALHRQIAGLQSQVGQLSAELEAASARVAELEQAIAALEQERQQEQARAAAADPALRSQSLESTLSTLAGAQAALTGGSDDVAGALEQARALLADTRGRAALGGSGEEARLAAAASAQLEAAQLALERDALYEARVALALAYRQAGEALARSSHGASGGAGPAPAAGTSGTAGSVAPAGTNGVTGSAGGSGY